jgi:signal transduction histidine kinase
MDAGRNGMGLGVGLGLSLCQKIVKGHRGEIAVQSRKGSGTCFTIFLPVPDPSHA